MRILTKEFLASPSRYYARLVLGDGREIGSEAIRSLTVSQSLNGATDRLTLGAAPATRLTAVVVEPPEGIAGQPLRLWLGRMVAGELEEVPLGIYTITETAAAEGTATLTGYDPMYTALEAGYYPTLTGATTAKAVLADVAAQAGVELADIDAGDVPVSGVTTGYTLREMAGYMAALLGCSARIDGEGRLALSWFQSSGLTVDGNVIYSGGARLATEDWTLGKLTCTVTTTATASETDGAGNTTTASTQSTATLTAGDGATGISLSNPWMSQAVLDGIFQRIGGLSYHSGTVSLLGDLRHEVGDVISVADSSGNVHAFPIMAQTIEYDGGLKMTLSAYASSSTAGDAAAGPLTQAVQRYAAELAFVRQLMADNLTATNAKIGLLDANKAEIRDLTAARASITALAARTAEIEQAYITDAEVGTLLADKATVEQLEAAMADIEALFSAQANIQNLLAGNAGVGVLQAIHLTGQNAVIDDAIITSAMIASLAADKLTAGTIYTDLVKIMSQNGHLVLKDNTLQISDGNRVRVQLGLDGAGDYNLALWDAEGNLLWDASGVYAAGLHDGIIRDVAVAEDANISGTKLNIPSVASRLTEDGTLIVDSGQVTIDGTTLSAAYKTLTQAAADAAKNTSALETDFKVVQGQVSSKVWQSDIETAVAPLETEVTTLSDQYSTLEQTVGGITTRVGDVETTLAQKADGSTVTELSSKVSTLEQTSSSITLSVNAVKQTAESAVAEVEEQYYLSTSKTSLSGGSWSSTAPEWTEGKYMWRRTKTTSASGTASYSDPVCIAGAKGDTGATGAQGPKGNTGATGATGPQGAKGDPGIDFSQGKMLFTDPMFASGVNSTRKYANSGGDYLTWARAAKSSDNPMTGTSYEMVCTNTGAVSPANGGFYWANASRANAVFIYRIIAKIPTGRSLLFATNATGSGAAQSWLTSNAGTGKFTEYIFKLVCGSTGTFSSTGFFYVNGAAGTASAPLVWYVAYATCFDMTNVSDVQSISAKLELKLDTDRLVSQLNASADEINITGNRLVIDSDNFQLDAAGNVTANNANLSGAIYLDNGLWVKKHELDSENEGSDYIHILSSGYATETTAVNTNYKWFFSEIEVSGYATVNGSPVLTKGNFLDMIYPVGTVYLSLSSTSPASLFGGTWTKLENRFLLGASSSYAAGGTGGEATHTLTTPEMPSHKHGPSDGTNDRAWVPSTSAVSRYHLASGTAAYVPGTTELAGWTWGSTAATGGGQPHNNMPPYLAVYMWRRTA